MHEICESINPRIYKFLAQGYWCRIYQNNIYLGMVEIWNLNDKDSVLCGLVTTTAHYVLHA